MPPQTFIFWLLTKEHYRVNCLFGNGTKCLLSERWVDPVSIKREMLRFVSEKSSIPLPYFAFHKLSSFLAIHEGIEDFHLPLDYLKCCNFLLEINGTK